jgi:hypothetical protein
MKRDKIIFWIATGLLSLMMLGSATMYFVKYADVAKVFTTLKFPTFVIYPLAIAKLLGVVAITTRLNNTLKEWAYAGFFFNFLLAGSGHIVAKDGEAAGAFIALTLLLVSYFFSHRAFAEEEA